MHIPVLQKEIIQYLDPKPNEDFIDCTIGEAGHSLAILERNEPEGKVLGIDQDPEMIKNLKLKLKDFKKRVVLVQGNFRNLAEIARKERFRSVSGVLFDLGMSSWHLEESGRGFSFLRNEPLDMRYDPRGPLTAEKILNYWSEKEIERVLREFGEEKFSQEIAKEIVERRKLNPIKRTSQLVKVIEEIVLKRYRFAKIHFATRTFQALRIAVNEELDSLKEVLPQALDVLKAEGKIAVISFHSLEDRIVKNFFKEKARENLLKILTKKPIVPSSKEIKINPRSRSSKLRVAQKI
jgi:16S rRNA (cytosine1402-N4)-methyltransferase